MRHGRKQLVSSTGGFAKDMIAKSRTGVYQPTGLTQMRQMEATSPWVVPKPESWNEACPDCVAELRIKRRELMREGKEDVLAALSTNKMKMEDRRGLVELNDLEEDLDAIIFERKGELKRVVLNSKISQGNTATETMQRLSHELARVSGEISRLPVPNVATNALGTTKKSTVYTSTVHPGYLDAKNASVPELLDMIDAAANEVHLNTGKVAEHYIRRPSLVDTTKNSFLRESEFDTVFADESLSGLGLVTRQGIDDHYRALHNRLVKVGRPEGPTHIPQPARPPPSPPSISHQPEPPRILMTSPTLPAPAPVKPTYSSETQQTPPPDHPSLNHAASLVDKPSPSPNPQTPTTHNYSALRFLNPFSRRGTPASTNNRPITPPSASPSPSSLQPGYASSTSPPPPQEKTGRVRPSNESPESTTPQPISSEPRPYHRVPRIGREFENVESHERPGADERQQQQKFVQQVRRQDKDRMHPWPAGKEVNSVKTVQEQSSLMEREARRMRSVGSGLAGTAAVQRDGEREVGQERKGWFG